jgi:hypothetical protein
MKTEYYSYSVCIATQKLAASRLATQEERPVVFILAFFIRFVSTFLISLSQKAKLVKDRVGIAVNHTTDRAFAL